MIFPKVLEAILAGAFTFQPLSLKQAEQRYGKLSYDYSWADKDRWLYTIDLSKYNKQLGAVTLNKDIIIPFTLTIVQLYRKGLIDEITEYKGCYNGRPVRGKERPSTHAYGLGCDFNDSTFSAEFVQVWKNYGWCWGGDFKRKDSMHFSRAWECTD